MRALDLGHTSGGALRLLCLGAHSDDIEIGCGGFILQLLRTRKVDVDWVVFSGRGPREREARQSAQLFLKDARKQQVIIKQFRDGFFPHEGADIKDVFEELKQGPPPDLVLTHYERDRHQDHRVLSELAWNTFRDHWILEYEIPKYDGDLGSPNTFVPLDRRTCERKVRYLQRAFGTQRSKHWFSDETFLGLMRLRGMECRAPSRYAEAFYSRKTVLHT
ncbi:MAG: PIG-L deacetylase family protein [Vicinamibacterales bacterium]